MTPKADQATKNFFISYTQVDRSWSEWIAWQLEEEGYTVIIQAWDFAAGANFIDQMDRALETAERTLLVLTPEALGSRFVREEWTAALKQERLIPVRVRKCDPEGLLGVRSYVDLVGLDEEIARSRLLLKLRNERAKPATAPAFPGATLAQERTVHERPAFPEGQERAPEPPAVESPAIPPSDEEKPSPAVSVEQPPRAAVSDGGIQGLWKLWDKPLFRRTFIGLALAAGAFFLWYQTGVYERLRDEITESTETYLGSVAEHDAAALTQLVTVPFFFGERELSTPDEVRDHFTRLFALSEGELGDESRREVSPSMYRAALLSQWLGGSEGKPHFDIFDAAEIRVKLDLYSSKEQENPTGPEPTLDLKPDAARADLRLKGFRSEDVEVVHLYFSIRDKMPYLRGVHLR